MYGVYIFDVCISRRLAEQYGKAAVEIEKKRVEIFTTEWNNMMKTIGDSFAV